MCLASQNTHFRHRSCDPSVCRSLRDLVCLVNQDTCCQFVPVVWPENSRDQMHTSMLGKDEGEKPANVAFCFAIFPSCSRPVGALPAGGETVETQASAAPPSPCKSLHHLHPRHRAAQKWKQVTLRPDRFAFGSRVSKFQVNVTVQRKITERL